MNIHTTWLCFPQNSHFKTEKNTLFDQLLDGRIFFKGNWGMVKQKEEGKKKETEQ